MIYHVSYDGDINSDNLTLPEFAGLLERYGKETRQLIICVLVGGLHERKNNPDTQESSFSSYCQNSGMPEDVLAGVMKLARILDAFDVGSAQTLLRMLQVSIYG